MGVWIGVVFHLVIPGLDMEGRRTVSDREREGERGNLTAAACSKDIKSGLKKGKRMKANINKAPQLGSCYKHFFLWY